MTGMTPKASPQPLLWVAWLPPSVIAGRIGTRDKGMHLASTPAGRRRSACPLRAATGGRVIPSGAPADAALEAERVEIRLDTAAIGSTEQSQMHQ
jgi:hypothetical protein